MATTAPAPAAPRAFDMLRDDYLAAIGLPAFDYATAGGIGRAGACTHKPPHIFRVADPRPGAKEGARVRVLAACYMRPAHASIAADWTAR